MDDFYLLIKSTAMVYKRCLQTAFKATLSSWKLILVQLAGLIILGIVSLILPSGNLIFSLIRGLMLAYFLSGYLCLVRYGLENEKFMLDSFVNDTNNNFSSVISALFLFFVISMTTEFLGQPFLHAAVQILMAVLLNPLPEVLYLRGGHVSETFSHSYEFVRDNFIEWFIPVFLAVILFVGTSPRDFYEILSINPLYQVELFLYKSSAYALNPVFYFQLILALFVLYFIMIFRGSLFRELEIGRRARMFKERS